MPDTPVSLSGAPSATIARLIEAIRAVVGDVGLLTDPSDTEAASEDWRRLYKGRTQAVIRPANTAEVAAVVRLCAEAGVPVVTQGGNTSMVGGAVPNADGSELVLSTARLNRVNSLCVGARMADHSSPLCVKAPRPFACTAWMPLPASIQCGKI